MSRVRIPSLAPSSKSEDFKRYPNPATEEHNSLSSVGLFKHPGCHVKSCLLPAVRYDYHRRTFTEPPSSATSDRRRPHPTRPALSVGRMIALSNLSVNEANWLTNSSAGFLDFWRKEEKCGRGGMRASVKLSGDRPLLRAEKRNAAVSSRRGTRICPSSGNLVIEPGVGVHNVCQQPISCREPKIACGWQGTTGAKPASARGSLPGLANESSASIWHETALV